MTLGNKIMQERKNKNYSQEELAIQIGVSRQTIYNWENNQAMPDLVNLKKLAQVFDMTIEQLMDENYTTKKNNYTDNIDQAIEAGAQAAKKHWRKSGYLFIYWGVGATIFGFIASIMMGTFVKTVHQPQFGFSEVPMNPMLTFFDTFPKIILIIGILMLLIGGYLVIKDYRINHKNN